jgi:hypothetical protein
LLEAADFVGPGGTIRVRTVLDPANQRLGRETGLDAGASRKVAEIVILGERSAALSRQMEPVERLFHSLTVSSAHRVSQRDSAAELNNGGSMVPPAMGAASDNLRIARAIAAEERALIHVNSGRADLLALTLQLRLNRSPSRVIPAT